MYYVIGSNGQQYGPVDEATVRGWLGEGRVSAASLSFRTGETQWIPLQARPELAEVLSAPPSAAPPAAPPPGPVQMTPDAPKEWLPFRGHYRAANPWTNNFRVFLRKGKLWMSTPDGTERRLVPLEGGLFRIGEERTPEVLRFDAIVEGWAQRASLSGVEYYRFFTP